ncbi:hypothetical protein T484DRAFT_1828530, partial [Baffinella frigidus]
AAVEAEAAAAAANEQQVMRLTEQVTRLTGEREKGGEALRWAESEIDRWLLLVPRKSGGQSAV